MTDGWSDYAQTPVIRPERPGDEAAIRAALEAAFPTSVEADLVERLRADGDLVLSYVATRQGIVGHVGFSRVSVESAPALRVVALAPLGVKPGGRNGGIGSALVRAGLERLAKNGEEVALVLGDPHFYGRFGFTSEAAAGLESHWAGPYLLGLALRGTPSLAGVRVRYAAAFSIFG